MFIKSIITPVVNSSVNAVTTATKKAAVEAEKVVDTISEHITDHNYLRYDAQNAVVAPNFQMVVAKYFAPTTPIAK